MLIGLIGDYDQAVTAHRAIPLALAGAAFEWVPTESITTEQRLERYDGLWCVPGSPYRSMNGALLAIRHARQTGRPFLGTCGGFQHAIIEYARDLLGWADADHAETSPDAHRPVISLLSCALVEASEPIELVPGTKIAAAYGVGTITEAYRCRYGLNPTFRDALLKGPLRMSAHEPNGEVRAVELDGHPFFVATLFQPERAALRGDRAPLVNAFVKACGP